MNYEIEFFNLVFNTVELLKLTDICNFLVKIESFNLVGNRCQPPFLTISHTDCLIKNIN